MYKRAGVEDHPSLPRSHLTRPSSSSSRASSLSIISDHHKTNKHNNLNDTTSFHHHNIEFVGQSTILGHNDKMNNINTNLTDHHHHQEGSIIRTSSSSDHHHHHHLHVTTSLGLSKQMINNTTITNIPYPSPPLLVPLMEEQEAAEANLLMKQTVPAQAATSSPNVDDLNRLLSYNNQLQQFYSTNINAPTNDHPLISNLLVQPQQQPTAVINSSLLSSVPNNTFPLTATTTTTAAITSFSDRLWEWNLISEANNREYSNMSFK